MVPTRLESQKNTWGKMLTSSNKAEKQNQNNESSRRILESRILTVIKPKVSKDAANSVKRSGSVMQHRPPSFYGRTG